MKQFLQSNFRFFIRALTGFGTVGALAPSSRFLARAMCDPVDWDSCKTVLEIGPGTGSFTEEIIRRLPADTQLVLVEKDEVFYKSLQEKYPNLTVLHGDVLQLSELLTEAGIDKVDAVISGLPLLLFSPEKMQQVFHSIEQHLNPGAPFIQFTYHAGRFRRMAKSMVRSVSVRKFVPRNLPPAYVLQIQP